MNERLGVPLNESDPVMQLMPRVMIYSDPPDHTRLRALVSKAFTPRRVQALQPRIREIADHLLDAVDGSGRMDAIGDFAGPLPVAVITEMLGIPVDDREVFQRWSECIVSALNPVIGESILRRANQAVTEMTDYLRAVVRERRACPRDDLVSALIAAEEQGERLHEEEVYATCLILLIGGHETTTSAIGNGLLALLCNPEELRKVRDDPSLIDSTIEEVLRFEGPAQLAGRIALQDLELGGKVIRKGQPIILALGAANHDPEQFPDPERFDVSRHVDRHLAFGNGLHFCLGAPLARAEVQIALSTIVSRLNGIRLDMKAPRWKETLAVRGLKELPVRF
jgi:cytochrome P450